MTGLIWRLIVGGLWKPITTVLGFFGIYFAGRRAASVSAENKRLKESEAAHDRINEADIGIGASDADNIEWMRKFHDKHRD